MNRNRQLFVLFALCTLSWVSVSSTALCPPAGAIPASAPWIEPFNRTLVYQPNNIMQGHDVKVAQWLLRRATSNYELVVDGQYGATTAAATAKVWAAHGRNNYADVTAPLGEYLLRCYGADGYKDDGAPASMYGLLYKVHVPVYANRSIETVATLYDANNTAALKFIVRTHGANDAHGQALNQFATNGITPTGLVYFDLNSPEDDPKDFGPYPINRCVTGIQGNAALLISDVRDGILLHTGEWPNWEPSQPMPNSHGCIQGHPREIEMVWKILVSWGVQVRNNTNGKLPYPYKPQGLLSVEEIPDSVPMFK